MTVAFAQSEVIHDLDEKDQANAILTQSNILVVATATFKAGSGGYQSHEMQIGNYEEIEDYEDQENNEFLWHTDGAHNFSLTYDSNTGNLEMKIKSRTNVLFTVYCSPVDWFNQVLFTFNPSLGSDCVFSGSFNDQNFSITTYNWGTIGGYQWGGVLIDLPDNNSNNVESFSISGTVNISTLLSYVNNMRGDIRLLKKTAPNRGKLEQVAVDGDTIHFTAVNLSAGVKYFVERSHDLQENKWVSDTNFIPAGSTHLLTLPVSSNWESVFYRLRTEE